MGGLQKPTDGELATVERVLEYLAAFSDEGYVKIEYRVPDSDFRQNYTVKTQGKVGAGETLATAVKFYTV